MATKLITRTAEVTEYKVKCFDLKAGAMVDDSYITTQTFKTAEKALTAIRKAKENMNYKVAAITDIVHSAELRVMTEEFFLANSYVFADLKEARAFFKAQGLEVEENGESES